jgi:membrane protease YdiL (CAAX protease family)
LWSTLAIAAPFFEETLFRGFLLPSLTKIVPFWSALAISGFLFAVAHLNLADLIPLTVLGMVLGFAYMRSGNLLTPMLLHSLWNSGSFLALVALGGN